jgi:bifunctional UDP-N-acetylglucosamine pyrophosphorylase/glucosamine-1-phosphate N-acetyltransferase
MLAARRGPGDPAVVVLGFRPDDTAEYARLITDGDGGLQAIVEHKDATPEQREITLCNSGFMAIDGSRLFALLDEIGTDNAKGEYYLTDIVAIARSKGWTCTWVEGPLDDVLGINSRAQLAEAESVVQRRLRRTAMDGGVTMLDPESVTLSHDTAFGRDVVIEPNVFFGPGVSVADNVVIKGFSHIEGAEIGPGAVVGPFARLRPGTRLETKAKVGNFVEAKNTVIEEGAKVNHLTYVGDSRIGAGANVGAGTITCNYDGFGKHHTDIGAGAFIGSNSTLVAPVTIGDGALVAAGSVVSKDVDKDALVLGRAGQEEKPGAAARFRQRKLAEKQKKSA